MKESHVYWSKNRHNKRTINTHFTYMVEGGTGYTTLSPRTFEQWHFSYCGCYCTYDRTPYTLNLSCLIQQIYNSEDEWTKWKCLNSVS